MFFAGRNNNNNKKNTFVFNWENKNSNCNIRLWRPRSSMYCRGESGRRRFRGVRGLKTGRTSRAAGKEGRTSRVTGKEGREPATHPPHPRRGWIVSTITSDATRQRSRARGIRGIGANAVVSANTIQRDDTFAGWIIMYVEIWLRRFDAGAT